MLTPLVIVARTTTLPSTVGDFNTLSSKVAPVAPAFTRDHTMLV
jgi:hypothetical protein